MHTQVVISLVAIAGAAAIALACDFLRMRNAQLREAMVDLESRKPAKAGARAPAIVPAAPISQTEPLPVEIGPRRRRRRPDAAEEVMALRENILPNPALADVLIERAVTRAARKGLEAAKAEAPSAHQRPAKRFELIQGSGAANPETRLPSGMHPPSTLTQLVESRQLFTGLVISIGVNPKDGREGVAHGMATHNMATSVQGFIAGLLRTADFGCQLNEEEFLLICPGPHGPEAQRHLSHVSERVWDYQLRTLGQFPIACSVGGVDVQREHLAEAIKSAQERMAQTRRVPGTALSVTSKRRQAV